MVSQQGVPVVNAPAKNDSSQYQQGLQQPTLSTPAGPASNVNVPTSSSLCCVNVRAPVLLQTADNSIQAWQSR